MRFILHFLAATGLIAGAYASVLVAVDPRADFATGLVPPAILDSRAVKQRLFLDYARSVPVEGLVLGSSRAMKLRPDELGGLLGARFFNFSVDSARAEDYLAVYRWVRGTGASLRFL